MPAQSRKLREESTPDPESSDVTIGNTATRCFAWHVAHVHTFAKPSQLCSRMQSVQPAVRAVLVDVIIHATAVRASDPTDV